MAGAAANEADQQAAPPASDPANARPQVDPQLLMAARLGNSKRLKALLGLNKDEAVVVVDVVPLQRTPSAAEAAGAGDVGPTTSAASLDGVTTEGSSLLHVVAACGDSDKFRDCAMLIYHMAERLLVARNGKGETPLHCAAGAGNAEMISYLIDFAASGDRNTEAEKAEKKVAYLRVHNKCGETALHHAVRAAAAAAGKKDDKMKKQLMALDCINRLMAADPQLAAIPLPNIAKAASPLYLAISLGEIGIAQHLFVKSDGNLSCSGPNGRNVLHAAVSHDQDDNKDQALQALPMVLEWLENKKLKTPGVDMQQLTSQRDNDNGSTPLHLAASMAGLPSLGSKSAGPSATSLLLEANESSAYQPDNQGRYPIHAAASAGSLEAVKALLDKCSDCATLRDARGRTFLHAAVEKKRSGVVRHVRRSTGLSSILNLQDDNGDTRCTPLSDPSIRIRKLLWILRAPFGESRGDLFDEKHAKIIVESKRDMEKMSENVTAAAQVLALFSVLITTVTFASAFTLPGGYRSAGDDGGAAGTPVLARRGSYAFDAFILADALAFVCSFVATARLLYAGVPAFSLGSRFRSINGWKYSDQLPL
uniref:PGG domain-containing protein n=1 Tax=Oryza punctata TaxID=4537 RepID=A0A0E0LKP0_ORYPU